MNFSELNFTEQTWIQFLLLSQSVFSGVRRPSIQNNRCLAHF